jgi:hypothetical protein
MKDAIKEVYDYEWRLANEERRLDESESICNEDKETARRFVRCLKAQDVLHEQTRQVYLSPEERD